MRRLAGLSQTDFQNLHVSGVIMSLVTLLLCDGRHAAFHCPPDLVWDLRSFNIVTAAFYCEELSMQASLDNGKKGISVRNVPTEWANSLTL